MGLLSLILFVNFSNQVLAENDDITLNEYGSSDVSIRNVHDFWYDAEDIHISLDEYGSSDVSIRNVHDFWYDAEDIHISLDEYGSSDVSIRNVHDFFYDAEDVDISLDEYGSSDVSIREVADPVENVQTIQVKDITESSAILEGYLGDMGDYSQVKVYFEYGLGEAPSPVGDYGEVENWKIEVGPPVAGDYGEVENWTVSVDVYGPLSYGEVEDWTVSVWGEDAEYGHVETWFIDLDVDSENPWYSDSKFLTESGYFEIEVDDLSPSTDYWVRAVAEYEDEKIYGDYLEFTTEEGVLDFGEVENWTFKGIVGVLDYGEVEDWTVSGWVDPDLDFGPVESWTVSVDTLEHPGWGEVENWGVFGEVITKDHGPVDNWWIEVGPDVETHVTTLSPVDVGLTSAVIRADYVFIDSLENAVVWFEWGTTTSMRHESENVEISESQIMTLSLEDLEPGEEYFYKGVMEVDGEMYEGGTVSFETEFEYEPDPSGWFQDLFDYLDLDIDFPDIPQLGLLLGLLLVGAVSVGGVALMSYAGSNPPKEVTLTLVVIGVSVGVLLGFLPLWFLVVILLVLATIFAVSVSNVVSGGG